MKWETGIIFCMLINHIMNITNSHIAFNARATKPYRSEENPYSFKRQKNQQHSYVSVNSTWPRVSQWSTVRLCWMFACLFGILVWRYIFTKAIYWCNKKRSGKVSWMVCIGPGFFWDLAVVCAFNLMVNRSGDEARIILDKKINIMAADVRAPSAAKSTVAMAFTIWYTGLGLQQGMIASACAILFFRNDRKWISVNFSNNSFHWSLMPLIQSAVVCYNLCTRFIGGLASANALAQSMVVNGRLLQRVLGTWSNV